MNKFTVMPDETAWAVCQQEHRAVYDMLTKRVADLMSWPMSKATKWMTEPNPMLGTVSPVHMLATGREARLEMFILEAECVNSGTRDWDCGCPEGAEDTCVSVICPRK